MEKNGSLLPIGNSVISPCNIDSQEYEFDSFLETTIEKDIDQVHFYKNLLEVGKSSRIRLDESHPTSVIDL